MFLFMLVGMPPAHAENPVIGGVEIQGPLGAELVDQESNDTLQYHLVVLGALEKVNRELEPEASEFVQARKRSWTWYLPEARRTERVFNHYLNEVEPLGELAFTCSGRGCGSSSYWANTIFKHAILYGPEQFQHYLAIRLGDGSGFLVVYIGERATRKIYVHIEQITTK